MADLKANQNKTQMKTLGLLQVMIKARRQKDKEFDEFKRAAGIRDDNHELIKNTLLPIPYLVQAREKGIMRNYMSSNNNNQNPYRSQVFGDMEDLTEKIEDKVAAPKTEF